MRDKIRVFRRGDVYIADFGNRRGTNLQSGCRPCIVISNRKSNEKSKILTVVPVSSKIKKMYLPTHVEIKTDDVCGFLQKDSVAIAEQVTTIDKNAVRNKLGFIKINSDVFKKIEKAVKIQMNFWEDYYGEEYDRTDKKNKE